MRIEDAAGADTLKEYNERGLLVREATKIEEGKYSILNHLYDDLSREIKTYRSDDPSCEPTTFAYDIWGRKTAETDAEGNTSRFSYNLLDHLLLSPIRFRISLEPLLVVYLGREVRPRNGGER